jgi:phosphoribosyl 1,2-cyclic phosphodiesterase
MQVTFWGVRGSTPTPGSSTVRYGGNTVCTEVQLSDGSMLILDAGTGIRELGLSLQKRGPHGPINLLLSHVHWDHILGLPFFQPLWKRGAHLRIFPVANDEQRVFARQLAMFDGVHFPIRATDIPARLELVDDNAEVWHVGPAKITRAAMNHPGGAQGFRIEDSDGSSLAYLTDNELVTTPPNERLQERLAAFARGVDVLIHDAQYLPSDMPAKRGWGHSVLDDVLGFARETRARSLVLFHHDPERNDDALDAIQVHTREWLAAHAPHTEGLVAQEGLTLVLPKR